MQILNEVTEYMSRNLDMLKILKVKNQTKMNIPRDSKYRYVLIKIN